MAAFTSWSQQDARSNWRVKSLQQKRCPKWIFPYQNGRWWLDTEYEGIINTTGGQYILPNWSQKYTYNNNLKKTWILTKSHEVSERKLFSNVFVSASHHSFVIWCQLSKSKMIIYQIHANNLLTVAVHIHFVLWADFGFHVKVQGG